MRKPEVFLFDEPLSNLDAKLRVQMRLELAKLHADLGTTMIYVTHDQTEAMTLADKIVVLDKGVDLAGRLAARTLQRAGEQVRRRLHRFAEHEFLRRRHRRDERPNGERRPARRANGRDWRKGKRSRRAPAELGVRPEHLAIVDPDDPHAAFAGAVAIIEHLGNSTILYVDTPAGQLIVEGEGNLDAKAGSSRRAQARRAPRASLRRERERRSDRDGGDRLPDAHDSVVSLSTMS